MPVYFDIHTHRIHPAAHSIYSISVHSGFTVPERAGYFSAGIHPWQTEISFRELLYDLEGLCRTGKLISVGEIGIDKLRGASGSVQETIFQAQVALAAQYKLPLIIHCVKASDRLIAILRNEQVKVPVIIHGFQSGWKQAVKYLDEGFFLSFGSALLRNGNIACSVFLNVPSDRFFLETDEYTGGIETIYCAAARLLGTTPKNLGDNVMNRVKQIFRINE